MKIIIAMAMHMPRNPHTIMRGTMPKPFLLYTPSRMRRASISPKVARMANLKNAMMKGCALVEASNQAKNPVAGIKKGANTTTTIKITSQSCFFML